MGTLTRKKSFIGFIRDKWDRIESMIGAIKDGEAYPSEVVEVNREETSNNNATEQAFWHQTMVSVDAFYIWNEEVIFLKRIGDDEHTVLCVMPITTGRTTISTENGDRSTQCVLAMSSMDQIRISIDIYNWRYRFNHTADDHYEG